MERFALKYRRNGSNGSGTWKEWKNIGYHVAYYIASSRAREAKEDNDRQRGRRFENKVFEN